MSEQVSDQKFAEITGLSAAKRYTHFVRQVADWKTVWSLHAEDGWVLMDDNNGGLLVPVWPHDRYATEFAIGDWAEAEATSIDLNHWLSAWIPGMENDGRSVAVFPVAGEQDHGVVVPPKQLHDDLEAELQQEYD